MGLTNIVTLTSDTARPETAGRSSNRLRAGVLVGKGPLPAWIRQLLGQMKQSNFADPILIIDKEETTKSYGFWDHAVFRLWRQWDRRFFKSREREEVSPVANDYISQIEISSSTVGPEVSLTPTDLARLFSANLDVLLDFAHAGRAPSLAAATKFGTWFFREDQCEQSPRGTCSASLLGSMLEGASTFELPLLVRRFPDSGLDLLSSVNAATDPISLVRAQAALDRQKPGGIMRTLSLLHQSECDWTVSMKQPAAPPAKAAPGNFEMTRFLFRRCGRTLWNKAQHVLRREQWVIGVRKRVTGMNAGSQSGYVPIVPPVDRFYADPFLVEKNEKNYLFFEELPFASNKGIISCLEIDGEGKCGAPRPVLELDHHLSYPFVFEWRGQMYMLPETRDSGRVSLFRAANFPYRWKLEKILMEDVWAVDPTLFEYAGKFWLFAGGVEKHGDINSELYLFFADSPLGPWTPHPLNPVVSDVRRARPAGKLFFHDGHLVRPGQDCSIRYGAAVVLNRVAVLSESQYREEPFGRLQNDWLAGNLGSHTFNSSEHFEVIDGRRLIGRLFLRAR